MKQFIGDLKKEFYGYNIHTLTKDVLAGLTVSAVALPLAFGVSSRADAGAG